MAEIKNTFLKSKMNKDLDDRVIPQGEYRDAQNVAISKSEDADVGALENILGNILVKNYDVTGVRAGLEIIGKCFDQSNNRVFVFLTNYSDTSTDKLSNFGNSACIYEIWAYDGNTNVNQLIVGGFANWLNFSKTHPITGINVLENMLYWTDDRNQPRKINVDTAIGNPLYYNNEDTVSVAKYAPYKPPRLYDSVTRTIKWNAIVGDYQRIGLDGPLNHDNLSIGMTVTGGSPAITEDCYIVGLAFFATIPEVYISPPQDPAISGDLTFYGATMKDVVSENLPQNTGTAVTANPFKDTNWPGDEDFLADKFVRFSYRFK